MAVRKTSRRRAARGPAVNRSPRVAILMGSASDWDVMKPAADALAELGVVTDVRPRIRECTPAATA